MNQENTSDKERQGEEYVWAREGRYYLSIGALGYDFGEERSVEIPKELYDAFMAATIKDTNALPIDKPEGEAAEGMRLEGEIKVGDRLIWEPHDRRARQEVQVVKKLRNMDGEVWVLTRDKRGKEDWNEESRIREACIRAKDG
jgi:hypothetical protein